MVRPDAKVVLKETLGKKFELIDEATVDYLASILQDEDTDKEDAISLIVPLLCNALEGVSEPEVEKLSQTMFSKMKSEPQAVAEKKVLNAPVMIARLTIEEEQKVKEVLRAEMPITMNFNDMKQTKEVSIFDPNDDTARREVVKSAKKEKRKERRDTQREKRWALERDEILKRLSNKPVKLHTRGDDGNRIKDIKLENVTMGLGSLELMKETTIIFSHGKKYGLVGRNGIGKTTFLKHLASHAFPGIPAHMQILHIEQEVSASEESVIDAVLATDAERDELLRELKLIQDYMEKDGQEKKSETAVKEGETEEENIPEDEFDVYDMTPEERADRFNQIHIRLQEIDADSAPPRASSLLAGLGFTPEMQIQPTKNFSGGWRMRIALAQALFISPDVLLLDEPSNHLDLHSVLWLEEYLHTWNKTLIVVSHDRDFLNAVVTDIIHMHNKTMFRYKGDYDSFEKQRVEAAKIQQRERDAQQKEIDHIQHFIDKNRVRASTAKMAQSRIKRLAKIEVIPELAKDPTFQFNIPEPEPLSGPVIQMVDVAFGYNKERTLYTKVNQNVTTESRVALVGPNGAGKSTLLKLMMGEIEPSEGLVKINPKAKIARFTQHHVDQLDLKKTPLQWFQEMYPLSKPQDIRKHLGGMGITGNLALQPIYSLSGGQKSRVAFAHITWVKPQLLLLDEPTNHLDMETVDALIGALNNYEGGVLIVSHDAYLISTVCDHIWVCSNGVIANFEGDFDDYRAYISKQNKMK